MSENDGSRKHLRVERILLTAYERYGAGGELEEASLGRTLDLSEGGVKLETHKPLPMLSRVKLTLADGEEIIDVEGDVIHLHRAHNNMIETGVEFVDLTWDIKEKLKQMVATRLARGE